MRRVMAGLMVMACAATMSAQEGTVSAEARLDALLEAMGGREAWAKLTGIRVHATHYEASIPAPFENVIVNDFSRPAFRVDARGPGYQRVRAINGQDGWMSDGRTFAALDAARMHDELRWWESNVYRTLQRLALRDPSLHVAWIAPDRLAVVRADGVRLNWFRLNQRHEPVAFGTWDAEDGTVFGPLANGPAGLKYPKWGASVDGRWRYEVDRVITFAGVVGVDMSRPTAPPVG